MSPAKTLPELLSLATETHAARPAFASPGSAPVTFGDLALRAGAVSRALAARGAGPGRILGLLSPNRPEWAVAFFGTLGAGAAVLPLDPHLGAGELANALAQFGVSEVLADEAIVPLLEGLPGISALPLEPSGGGKGNLPEGRPGDLAVLIASSGTTGKPKGVMLSHANLLANLDQFRECLPVGPEDAFLALLPLHHAFPLMGTLLASMASGGRVVIPDGMRPPAILQAMAGERVSFGLFVPGVLRLMAKAAERAGGAKVFGPALRAMVVGGAPCPLATLEACERLGLPVLEGYGMSEASPVIAMNTFAANRPGTVGRPVPGLEVRIAGDREGDIQVKGPNVMMGYYRDAARTDEVLRDGWLSTGDIGALDAEGFLTIRGRAKNVIISESGKNVYPEEIEAELAKSELIKECCVLGRVVDGTERIVSVVVPREPTSREVLETEVRARCAALAEYKRVQEVRVWEGELPKTAAGKVRVAAVKEKLA